MALEYVKLASGREATGDKAKETSTRVYVVKYDTFDQANHYASKTANDGTTSIPSFNASHPDNISMQVTSITSEPIDDYYKAFKVTVSYAEKSGGSSGQENEDPLARPTKFVWSSITETEEYYEDFTEPTPEKMANSAGVPFDNNFTRPIALAQVSITKNVATKLVSSIFSFTNTTNKNAKTIDGYSVPADRAYCESISWSEELEENGVLYFTQTINIRIKEQGYDLIIPDRGYGEKDGGDIKPILDKNKQPVQEPWPLDGNGNAKANIDDDPEELTRKPYKSVDWGSLDLT